MKKILIVFGTRPEAIKMAPVIHAFKERADFFHCKVCITGQHRELVKQVLDFFEIVPDYDLQLMTNNQSLTDLSAAILLGMKPVIGEFMPDFVFVHGDTTTSAFSALASFYAGVKICHVEAGLRTYQKHSPFPEEINRQIVGRLADLHFAPTLAAQENLLREGVPEHTIFVTGNTVIDALLLAKQKISRHQDPLLNSLSQEMALGRRLILVTCHRRENFGEPLHSICTALVEIANRPDVLIVFPVHPNPNVADLVKRLLGNIKNVVLTAPSSYPTFVWLMEQCYFIVTDSGGIQEEAPSLGKPVLVMREVTERPEAVSQATVKLVGSNQHIMTREINRLLDDPSHYKSMQNAVNPYGDGTASIQILKVMTS